MVRFVVVDCEQRSEAWLNARLGKLTGTGANDMLAKPRVPGEGLRRKLLVRLSLERITGIPGESKFQSQSMQNGVAREADAFFAYERHTGCLMERTGFLSLVGQWAGCSLDGHVGDFEGLVSIKCPEQHTHLDTLRSQSIPLDYMRQIIHEQWITGAAWTDYVSYHPDFPERLQLRVIRVPRNEQAIEEYEQAALAFLRDVSIEEEAIRTMAHGFAGAVA